MTVSPFTPAESKRLTAFRAQYVQAAKHPPLSYHDCQRLLFVRWLAQQRGERAVR